MFPKLNIKNRMFSLPNLRKNFAEFKNYLIEQLDHFWSTRVISAGLTISTESQNLIKGLKTKTQKYRKG